MRSSTEEIGGLIRSVQQEAENARGAMQTGSESVASGVDLSAEALAMGEALVKGEALPKEVAFLSILLQKSLRIETKKPIVANYHVIHNPNAQDLPYTLQAPGDLHILPTRGGISARVIVHQHYGSSGLTDNGKEDLPGMHNGRS